MTRPADRAATRRGLLYVAVLGLLAVALLYKAPLLRVLTPGDPLTVEFSRDYKLDPDHSDVKLAGVPVGTVAGVSDDGAGTVEVELDLDRGVLARLGSSPGAEIRPTTVLGGTYYVSLVPGGGPGEPARRIPVERTRTPVELDLLLSAIPPDAQGSLRAASGLLDRSLRAGAGEALGGVLDVAPGTLEPAAAVLDAARGTRPDTDLATLVTDVRSAAAVATARGGQLESVVDSLAATSATLADRRGPLAATVADLPETLRTTRTGADDVRATLDRLAGTAADLRPTAVELDPLLARLGPALTRLRPLLAELRPVLADARPLVRALGPLAGTASTVLDDVRGPVLDRLNGPIIGSLNDEWRGLGPKYEGSGGVGHPFHEEIGYLATTINGGIKTYDGNGSLVSFQIGLAPSSLVNEPGGLDMLEQALARLGEASR